MKASLRSVRIAPKKASLVAKMVRGQPVPQALSSLQRTQKKAARILEGVIQSAAANARQNDGQNPDNLIVKTLTVNKAQSFHRGVPMARGRWRRMRKFLSHIEVTLGYPEDSVESPRRGDSGEETDRRSVSTNDSPKEKAGRNVENTKKESTDSASQKPKKAVQKKSSAAPKATKASAISQKTSTGKARTSSKKKAGASPEDSSVSTSS